MDEAARTAGAVTEPHRRGERRLSARLTRPFTWLGDILMPPLCLNCHKPLSRHHALCPPCWRQIDFIRPPLCDRLGLPLPFDPGGGAIVSAAALADPPDYDRARAVAVYGGTMRQLIRDLKFHDRHDAKRLFGRWLVESGQSLLSDPEALLVPVPLNPWRLIARRFNQAAVLAQEVSRLTGHRCVTGALSRVRVTESQVGKTRAQRRENVRGAFRVHASCKDGLVGRHVVLVDDVVTTGATAGACARALKRAGAGQVDVLALALATGAAENLG